MSHAEGGMRDEGFRAQNADREIRIHHEADPCLRIPRLGSTLWTRRARLKCGEWG
jgi:hypothetical protein